MPTVTLALTNEQVVELVEQLPPDQQSLDYQRLASKQWGSWIEASRGAEAEARAGAGARPQLGRAGRRRAHVVRK